VKRKLAALCAAVALVLPVLAVTGATTANAYVGPGDDRQRATPTAWWWYTNVDAATVSAKLSANGARLTDISVYSESPLRFNVTMVANTGSYATGWYWYYGLTFAQMQQKAADNLSRITVAKTYATSSGVRVVAIMVRNTGTYAEPWWWYYGSVSFLSSKLSANSARLVGLHRMADGNYLGVMARNTGNDATGWWWYVNASISFISQKATENKARIVDLSRNPDGTFNVVMYSNPGYAWWWWVNTSMANLHDKALQSGARIIDVQTYSINGVTYYAGVFVDNLNALSGKIRNLYSSRVTTGHYGFELKQIGGSRLAALQEFRQFEPASSLKVLYHLHSIRAQQAGSTTNSSTITYHYNNLSDPNDGNICPDSYATTTTTNLQNADTLMMQRSDNRMTRGILEKYGKANILSTATSVVGMTGTQINHNIGCGTPHNYTTLEDLRKIYEGVQNKTLVSNATWNSTFKYRMLNQSNYSAWRTSSFCPLVQEEATKLGKSSTTVSQFCNAASWYAKGGSYQYAGSYPYTVSWSGASVTGIPYKSSGTLAPRYFYFGDWVDGTNITSDTVKNNVSSARNMAYREAMRGYIRAALMTWA
jgi:hypothetical protein